MLQVNIGLMKAGKSKKLIELYKKHSETCKVGVFAYKPHVREAYVEVSTRAKDIEPNEIRGVQNLSLVKDKEELMKVLLGHDVLLIDEIQFADISHLNVINYLATEKEIYCFGLNKDFMGHPFEAVSQLIKKGIEANRFVEDHLKVELIPAECEDCGAEAVVNIRLTHDNELFVVDKDIYKTLCLDCAEGY